MIVLDMIRNNPTITRDELSQRIGITPDGIKYHISKLKEAGIIERIGGDKGGYWKIND
ncbi:MAG: winged helix-turn-helix transcriptional regulator [Mogibacterium sp.]|nr:winged helix-turn-helix transcriptional regulator [Mogibacterium sp.]